MSPAAKKGFAQWCQWLDIESHVCMEYTSSIDYEPQKLKQVLDGGLALALKSGRTLKAMGLIAGLESELDRLQKEKGIHKRMPAEQRKRIVVVAAGDPIQVAGAWVRDLVEMAGGMLCLEAGDNLFRNVTRDEIAASRPDMIFVPAGMNISPDVGAPVVEVEQLSDYFIPGPGLYACIRQLTDLIIP